MKVRSIDINRDWLFGKGRNNYVTEDNAIAQSIATRLRSFLGDCFFAQTEGIDWFNLLGAKDQTALGLAVSTTILNTDGVTGLSNFNFDLDSITREFRITYGVNTIYGDLESQINIDLEV